MEEGVFQLSSVSIEAVYDDVSGTIADIPFKLIGLVAITEGVLS